MAAGSTFGRYRLIRTLGQGGMGAVYLAHDSQLDRQVALKIPHLSEQDGPEVLERFYREAKAAAALDHPNLCPVYDVGQVDGSPYLTMAYVEGRPLSDLIGREPALPLRQAAALVRKLAVALQEAHDSGVVHRDLKPANVLLSKKRELVVVDFGLARRDGAGDPRLTKSGAILGTPAYMAPEQVSGDYHSVGPCSDVYALGVILYELLTGRLPFEGPVALVLGQIMVVTPEPPSRLRSDVDAALESICLKALAKDPGDRHASMREFAAALTGYLRGMDAALPQVEAPSPDMAPATSRPTGGESLVAHFFEQMISRSSTGSAAGPPEVKRSAGLPPARPRRAMVAAGAAALLGLLLGVILYVKTDEGTVRIELNDPGAQVEVKVDGTSIAVEGLGEPLKLRVGEHRLEVQGKDFVSRGESFTVKRGNNPTVRVEVLAKKAETLAVPLAPADGSIAGLTSGRGTGSTELPPGDSPDLRREGYADRIAEARRFLEEKDVGQAAKALSACPTDLRGWEWYYCQQICDLNLKSNDGSDVPTFRDAQVLTIEQPTGTESIAFSPDGSRVVYTTNWGDPTLILRDLSSGKEIARKSWQSRPLRDLAYSPNGRMIGAVGVEGLVQIWRVEPLGVINTLHGHIGPVYAVTFSPDGRRLITAGEDKTVRVWSTQSGKELQCLRGHAGPPGEEGTITSVAASPDGRYIISGSYDRTIKFWDATTGQEQSSLDTVNPLCGMILSRDGRRIAAACFDSILRIWDVESKAMIKEIDCKENLNYVDFSPDSERLITASAARQRIEIRDAKTGRELMSFGDRAVTTGAFHGLAFSPDGRRIAAIESGGDPIRIWSIHDRGNLGTPEIPGTVADGFRTLFNGKDLTGWKTFPGEPNNWKVENGLLIGSGPHSTLFTERGDYKNFHFRVEARINDRGNSGQFFRSPFAPGFFKTYEAQIGSTNLDPQRTGSLYNLVRVLETPIPPGTWFTQEVIADGKHIVIKVNGQKTVDYAADPVTGYVKGHLALEQHHPGSVVEFRKVEVRELAHSEAPATRLSSKAAASPPDKSTQSSNDSRKAAEAPGADGFRPLFNGKDLAGWRVLPGGTAGWRIEDGKLIGSGTPATLYTERGDFENFHLRFEARLSERVDGQVLHRGGMPNGESLVGYRTRIGGSLHEAPIPGFQYSTRRSVDTPALAWFTQEIINVGDRLTVRVNGETKSDSIDSRSTFRRGHIGFVPLKPDGVLEIRKVEIKDVPPSEELTPTPGH